MKIQKNANVIANFKRGDGTASVKSVNTSLLSQNEDDVLIIDCSI